MTNVPEGGCFGLRSHPDDERDCLDDEAAPV